MNKLIEELIAAGPVVTDGAWGTQHQQRGLEVGACPDAWNIEFTHANGHTHGAPGLFGFAPQSRFRVYIDNIMVTPND